VIDGYERYASDLLARCLEGDDYPYRKAVNCSAESGLLMFDPLGDVYACWEDIGEPEHRIATYGAAGLAFRPEIATAWLQRFPGTIETCAECPYALAHASGCAKHARTRTGSIFASDCDGFQELFPESLASAYTRFERGILHRPESAAAE